VQNARLFGYQVEIDTASTKAWYGKSDEWGCDCGHCRNFLMLASKRKLPAPILEILSSLDIPPEKATYVCELCSGNDGIHYQFSYRIAGRILSQDQAVAAEDHWGGGRCCHEPYPYGAPGFPSPHFDLEFWAALPWVLGEDPDG